MELIFVYCLRYRQKLIFFLCTYEIDPEVFIKKSTIPFTLSFNDIFVINQVIIYPCTCVCVFSFSFLSYLFKPDAYSISYCVFIDNNVSPPIVTYKIVFGILVLLYFLINCRINLSIMQILSRGFWFKLHWMYRSICG